MVKKYQSDAEKMCSYFKKHLNDGSRHWQYGYDVSIEWLRLVRVGLPSLEEVQSLLEKVHNQVEEQGSAFDELKFLICRWNEDFKDINSNL